MKKRTKFVMVAMALCLTVALGVLGIFAVKTLNMTVGGNITFSADGISFTITDGTFKTLSNAEYTGINSDTTKLKGFAMNTNTTQASVQDKIDSWKNLNLTMSSLGDAVLHFSITNNMTTETMYVYLDILHGENTNNNMSINQTGSGEAITPSQTKAFTLTFDILDESINAALTGFEVKMLFTRTQKPINQTESGLNPITPEQKNELVTSDITMQKPEFAIDSTNGVSIRFRATMTDALRTELESGSNKKLAMMIMPIDFYNGPNKQNAEYIDWINVLNKEYGITKQQIIFEEYDVSTFASNSFSLRIGGVLYNNSIRKFLGLALLETLESDGTYSYQYAQFADGTDYRSNAMSLADALSYEFNRMERGLVTHTDAEIATMNKAVNDCADKANGLTAATNDGSKFDFSVNLAIPQSFAVGTTVPMEVRTNPNVEKIYADYVFSNPSVAKIDSNGNLVTLAKGTTTISVYVFGEVKTVTINVA